MMKKAMIMSMHMVAYSRKIRTYFSQSFVVLFSHWFRVVC